MSTTRRPCGGPEYLGRLDLFWRGESFDVLVNQPSGATNWTGWSLRLELDGPLAADGTATTRRTLNIPGDGSVAAGGASATFSRPDEWGVANLSDGDWEAHFYEKPPGGEWRQFAFGVIPVATPPKGPTA